jgi:hypothetical protein
MLVLFSGKKTLGFGDTTGWNQFSAEIHAHDTTGGTVPVFWTSISCKNTKSQLLKEQCIQGLETQQVGNHSSAFGIHIHDITGQVPDGLTDKPINHLPFTRGIYVSAPRDTYGQRQVKDLQIRTYTDKHPNHDSNLHTGRVLSYLQTLQAYYKEQHSVSVDATQKQEFSCHVLYSDKLLEVYK